ncbi:hypothetical protein SRHO_G00045110 [Serrasalmus rhombeus]
MKGWLNPDGSQLPGADRWKESSRSLKKKKMRERKVEKNNIKRFGFLMAIWASDVRPNQDDACCFVSLSL